MPKPIFLRLAQLPEYTGISRSQIYAKVKAGTFPAPVPLGSSRIVGFYTEQVDAWAAEQMRAAQDPAVIAARTAASSTASARRREAIARKQTAEVAAA